MTCRRCLDQPLDGRMGPRGAIVEICPRCSGVWLEKGQIYDFVKDPRRLHDAMVPVYKNTSASRLLCCRCDAQMLEVQFPEPGPLVDVCAKCGGTWFDGGEVAALNALLDRQVSSPAPAAPAAGPSAGPSAGAPPVSTAAAVALPALPSLAARSAGVLGALYGVLCLFSAFLAWKLRLPLDFVFLSSAAALIVSYLVNPWLMDLGLRWLHAFRWLEPSDLKPELRRFLETTCARRGIPFPRLGLIEDENPNAFTYGRLPSDARLIVTQGVLDMLDEAEVEAVVAHELGHIAHYDMVVMTLAALVPMILYAIYRACFRRRRYRTSSSKDDKGGLALIGAVAFLLYVLTEYVVLFLSRTRELYADRFSGEVTGRPNDLASALVKIAYGLAGRRDAAAAPAAGAGAAEAHATRALGIFDPVAALGLVASTLSGQGRPSKEAAVGAMRWDLANPWAAYYELQSTHPLPARRLEYLGEQAAALGQPPFVSVDLSHVQREWGEFFCDLAVLWLPWALALASLAVDWRLGFPSGAWARAAVGWALGELVLLRYSYPTGFYPDATVASLLKKVRVSRVSAVPVCLRGKIIGRGVPGYLVSEDVVVQDETGFLFVDYKQPLALFEWLFALTRVGSLIGRDVVLFGWYRRGPVPYLELRRLLVDGDESRCWTLEAQWAFAALVLLAGLAFWLAV